MQQYAIMASLLVLLCMCLFPFVALTWMAQWQFSTFGWVAKHLQAVMPP